MLKHWIWLSQRKGIGHVSRKKLLSVCHSAEEIYEMTAEQYKNLGLKEMCPEWIAILSDKDLTEAERIVADCARYQIQGITYNDDAYPQRLKNIYDPPCVLYCKGTMPDIDREAVVAVVGSRRCTNYSLILAKQLSCLLSLSGGVVVSGGARGIDTVALAGALNSYMPVICVLAGGLDQYYPRENKKLFDDITRQGCLLSENPPGVRPVPNYFVGRNRLISGLSLGVLVVEAPRGSGALTTAELALSQNRDVFTIQRADEGAYNQGNRDLIDGGCEVVRDGWELISRYAHLFPDRIRDGRGREAMQLQYYKQCGQPVSIPYRDQGERKSLPERNDPVEKPPSRKSQTKLSGSRPSKKPSGNSFGDLPEAEAKVLSVFGNDPLEVDEIIMRSRLDATAVSTALTMLQIKKRVIKCFGNSYQRI